MRNCFIRIISQRCPTMTRVKIGFLRNDSNLKLYKRLLRRVSKRLLLPILQKVK